MKRYSGWVIAGVVVAAFGVGAYYFIVQWSRMAVFFVEDGRKVEISHEGWCDPTCASAFFASALLPFPRFVARIPPRCNCTSQSPRLLMTL